jgi:putative flippase GtrA
LRTSKHTEDNGAGDMNIPAQPGLHPRTPPVPVAVRTAIDRPRSRRLRDSMHTHVVLLRFCALSFVTAVIDNLIFYLVFHATGTILGAQIAARAISVTFNYRYVRRTVFFSDKGHNKLLPRYLALVAVNALLSYLGIRLLSAFTPLSVIASKIVAETLLFITNFAVQRAFIFTRRPPADCASQF